MAVSSEGMGVIVSLWINLRVSRQPLTTGPETRSIARTFFFTQRWSEKQLTKIISENCNCLDICFSLGNILNSVSMEAESSLFQLSFTAISDYIRWSILPFIKSNSSILRACSSSGSTDNRRKPSSSPLLISKQSVRRTLFKRLWPVDNSHCILYLLLPFP